MKTERISTPFFDTYPLRVVEDQVVGYEPGEKMFKILRSKTTSDSSERKKIDPADPANWDENWFGNYE